MDEVEESRVAALAESERLRRELARAFAGVVSGDAFVGYRCGERVAGAWLRDAVCGAAPSDDGDPHFAPIRVGCIAKLLTATLARRAFAARSLTLDEPVGHVLGAKALGGITARHLLDHTHGLDDSRLAAMPRRADGRVDVDALVRAVCEAPALAPPGAIYSYGSAGAWLVAALLERVDVRSYSAQVREGILAPLGIHEPAGFVAPICPATGGALALAPADLLRFAARAVHDGPDAWPDDERPGRFGNVTPFPGWCPLERGVHLGWKYHGRGWFGHQSVWRGASVLVRAQPRRALTLVVASREHPAAVVAARVFGAELPELFDLRIPARQSVVPRSAHVGTFASAAWRVAIRERNGGLELRARTRGERDGRCASLQRAAGGVLFTRPIVDPFPHVELVRLESGSTYLWNGRFVLRRVDQQPNGRP